MKIRAVLCFLFYLLQVTFRSCTGTILSTNINYIMIEYTKQFRDLIESANLRGSLLLLSVNFNYLEENASTRLNFSKWLTYLFNVNVKMQCKVKICDGRVQYFCVFWSSAKSDTRLEKSDTDVPLFVSLEEQQWLDNLKKRENIAIKTFGLYPFKSNCSNLIVNLLKLKVAPHSEVALDCFTADITKPIYILLYWKFVVGIMGITW